MVTATKGTLISCDIPTKVLILSFNEQKSINDRFVIKELDATTLLINPKALPEVLAKIKEYNDSITYQPPDRKNPTV